jgi:hypothetical protein
MQMKTLLMAGAVAGLALSAGGQASAQSASEQIRAQQAQIDYMKRQIELMQQKLQDLQKTTETTQQTAQQAAEVAAEVAPPKDKNGKYKKAIRIGGPDGVTVTPGGFIEAAGIFRDKNMSSDVGENFNAVPFGNVSNDHLTEDRFTARQSRLSLLATADVDPTTHVGAYYEMDFLGAAGTANSKESNSYNLRIRNIYATLDWDTLGLHLLAGQSWSLATMYNNGLSPLSVNLPMTIDAQYAVGFNWTRQPQFRIVKDFDKQFWLALSVENPQTTTTGTFPSGAGYQNAAAAGGGGLFDTDTGAVTYTDDAAPDIVAKAVWEPGWGHYEAYGIARFFRDRANFQNKTDVGGGVGGGAILPVLPKVLDIQLSGLVGQGIGRYGTGQLPDVTYGPNGSTHPLTEYQILAGVVGHPDPSVDLYAYGGLEHADRWYQNVLSGKTISQYGYGDPLANNSGCHTEGSSACVANTRDLAEGTVGFWWHFYHGDFGDVRWGAQYEYVSRNVWGGIGGGGTADNNILMTSFRYYPF